MSTCVGAGFSAVVFNEGDCYSKIYNYERWCYCPNGKNSSCEIDYRDNSYVCKATDRKRTSRKLRRKVHH